MTSQLSRIRRLTRVCGLQFLEEDAGLVAIRRSCSPEEQRLCRVLCGGGRGGHGAAKDVRADEVEAGDVHTNADRAGRVYIVYRRWLKPFGPQHRQRDW